ncbi:ABC-type Na+ efflux pump permease subunit [Lysobacter niastensis]|uniref:ABC-type Na+ efflux pump permease subunit n=1 Tax=Lysobacter niastensis TaxID=380629 RepID=A0ABU1W9R4_9GAMM|nr:hypothetical protein [Lysobacter niastensis]MDR7134065.1 ABC-type Na+ efflux pump permease subunit [Lysobacter niastensis]
MPTIAVPRSAIAALAAFYALTLTIWLLLIGGFDDPHWITFSLSSVVAAVFVSFGVSLGATLRFFGAKHPAWLGRTQAAYLAVAGLLLQSLLAGTLALVGVWPHKDLWFLGVIPFLWRG